MIRKKTPIQNGPATNRDPLGRQFFESFVKSPGLISETHEIKVLASELPKRLAVFENNRTQTRGWVMIAGGTGTGKSTLFNALCGAHLSDTGVERPKTWGPIAFVLRGGINAEGFPLPSLELKKYSAEGTAPAQGRAGQMFVLEHDRKALGHLIFIDTPDLDSVAEENRQMTEDLFLLADVVIFVSSQEKYADDVPSQFLGKILAEKRPYFFVLNKAHENISREEITEAFEAQGLALEKKRIWLLPHLSSTRETQLMHASAFEAFAHVFFGDLTAEKMDRLRSEQNRRRIKTLKARLARLIHLLEAERQAAEKWLGDLDAIYHMVSEALIRQERQRFTAQSRDHLQRQIRRLFSKYDVLARPRRFIQGIFLLPFKFLGMQKGRTQDRREDALVRIKEKMNFVPVQSAVERFNRLILEKLSPPEQSAPLYRGMRQMELILSEEEIKSLLWRGQDELAVWLEGVFKKFSQDLSSGKKWGIYSTSILWGVLILSFEAAVGGGFTALDAALDSVLAPLVTKGTVELFAYREIQKIARELAERYQNVLLSVLGEQRKRYEHCLEEMMPPRGIIDSLAKLQRNISKDGRY
jgi:energy-coupling factor transporter ATP-binding protein EcfA2